MLKTLVKTFLVAPLLLGAAAASQAAAEKEGSTSAGVAAQIGDRKITFEEVDKKVQATDPKAFQALYDARKTALDAIISDALLDNEAKARGVTRDKLVETEITQKVKPVGDAEVQAFFNERQAQMGGQTLEQVKDKIKPFLEQQTREVARTAFMDQLKKKASVKLMLQPPRMEMKAALDDPAKGPATAPVLIVEFSDFQ